jgi:hypothetical protein
VRRPPGPFASDALRRSGVIIIIFGQSKCEVALHKACWPVASLCSCHYFLVGKAGGETMQPTAWVMLTSDCRNLQALHAYATKATQCHRIFHTIC